MDVDEDLYLVRNQICDWALITSVILGIPTCLASLSRWPTIGWHWVIGLQSVFTVVLIVIVLNRKSIAYRVRAGFLVVAGLSMGLSGMATFGLLSSSIPLLLIAPIVASFLFDHRVAIATVVVSVIGMCLIAIGFIAGVFTLGFDASQFLLLKPAWINYVLVVLMAMAIPVAANIMVQKHLLTALQNSRKKKRELQQMVEERTLELERAKSRAEHLARTDELTGLNNRRAFMERAELMHGQAQRHNHQYVILMIDIDFFKKINDTWGHWCGDAVLCMFGFFIGSSFRSSDIVGRIGGEEFIVMLPETRLEEAVFLAQKLREKVELSGLHLPDTLVKYTCSIGVAELDSLSATLETVIGHADVALYQAKQAGRNRVMCYDVSVSCSKALSLRQKRSK